MSAPNLLNQTPVAEATADVSEVNRSNPRLAPEARRLRWLELALVLFVAFAHSLIVSVYALATSARLFAGSATAGQALSIQTVVGLVLEIAAIAVLAYVLFRQGRSFRDLGLGFSWRDLPWSIALAIAGMIASYAVQVALWLGSRKLTGQPHSGAPRNVEFIQSLSLWVVLLVTINPFFEELIVRAFLITEIKMLTGLSSLAVIASVGLQCSYHLYQGWAPALTYAPLFLIFSLYYVKTRRITPVILSHFYIDALALLMYAR